MKRMLIIISLVVMASSGFTARQVVLTCDADTYASLSKPDTNFGTENSLLASNAYNMLNNKYTTFDVTVAYLHFPIPTSLVGKVKVTGVGQYYYIDSIKSKTPYTSGGTIYTFELEHLTKTWTETGLTMNNAPDVLPPFFYDGDSSKGTYNPKVGWNKFLLTQDAVFFVQDAFNKPKINYGMGIVLSIFPPSSETTYLDGAYLHQIIMSSRETVKRSPYMIVEYEWKSGVKPAASEIQTMSLGEVKATYR